MLGALKTASDTASGLITRTYDGLDDLQSEATTLAGTNHSIAYQNDSDRRRTSMTVDSQQPVNYSYDAASRVTQITQGTASVIFTYDAVGRRTSMTLPNGVVALYTYDADSHLTGITYNLGATLLGNLTYSYDAAGRIVQKGGSFASTNLPAVLSTATYDADNQLKTFGGSSYTYDSNGNLKTDGTNTYTWNNRNQLGSITGGASSSFQYDAFGRRIGKTLASITTTLLYDEYNIVEELSGGTPTATLLTGLGVDETYSRTDSSAPRYLLSDLLGSTIVLTDVSGVNQTQYTYDPFGNTTSSGAASANPYQYTGRENDGTGLYFYRARYMSPGLQRFISEDPPGFAGGGPHLYAYAYNSPTNVIDPSGNCPWCIVGGLGAGFGGATEGYKGYKCGDRGWKLAGDIGRGMLAGGIGALAGLGTGLASGNPFFGGAAGSGAYDLVNTTLQGGWSGFGLQQGLDMAGDTLLGAATGGLAEWWGPAVRGGSNFNPFLSSRTFGPKAMQEYSRDGISGAMGTAAAMAQSGGRGNCDCR